MWNPYGNPYQQTYPPYQQMGQMQPQQQQVSPLINQDILRVSGLNGVNALNLAPNTSALALDTTAPILWVIQADGAGYKTPTAYDLTLHEEKKAEDTSSFADIITNLENRISKIEGMIEHGESGSQTASKSVQSREFAKNSTDGKRS